MLPISANLSELIGIYFNSGDLTNNFKITYTFDIQNKSYVKYVKNLLESEFNQNFKKQKDSKNISLYRYSKEIWIYLDTLGIKSKKIPEFILKSKTLSEHFLKGLLQNNACIKITDKYFLDQLSELISNLGYKPILNENLFEEINGDIGIRTQI